jgi:hypothetical protein
MARFSQKCGRLQGGTTQNSDTLEVYNEFIISESIYRRRMWLSMSVGYHLWIDSDTSLISFRNF